MASLEDSGSSKRRVAAIDIGTNAVRLVVGEATVCEPDADKADERETASGDAGARRTGERERASGEVPVIVAQARLQTRLGEGLDASGRLGDEPMERTLTAIGLLKARAEILGASRIGAVATAAVRDAANGRQFQADVERCTGLPLQVISPEREAELALRSARHRFELSGRKVALADLGGGSLEVSLIAAAEATATPIIERTLSLPLGAVRLTERFVRSDPVSPGARAAMTATIDAALRGALGEPAPAAECLIGSGGTFNALLGMQARARSAGSGVEAEKDLTRAQAGAARAEQTEIETTQPTLTTKQVAEITARIHGLTLAERRQLPGLDPSRADIIVAGITVVAQLAEFLGAAEVWVNSGGVREGLLLELCG